MKPVSAGTRPAGEKGAPEPHENTCAAVEQVARTAVESGGPLPALEFAGAEWSYLENYASPEALRAVLEFPDFSAEAVPHPLHESPGKPFHFSWREQLPHCRGLRPFRPRALRLATERKTALFKAGLRWREPIAVVIDEEEDYASFVGYALHREGYRVIICSNEDEIRAAGTTVQAEIAEGRAYIARAIAAAAEHLEIALKRPGLAATDASDYKEVIGCAIAAATIARDCEHYVYALIAQDVMLQLGERGEEPWTCNLQAREEEFPELYRRDHGVSPWITVFSTNPDGHTFDSDEERWWIEAWRQVRQCLWPKVPETYPLDSDTSPEAVACRANRAYIKELHPCTIMGKPLGGIYTVREWIRRARAARTAFPEKEALDAARSALELCIVRPIKEPLVREHVEKLLEIVNRVYRLWDPTAPQAPAPRKLSVGAAAVPAKSSLSHAAPGKSQPRALALLARARWLDENGQTSSDWLRGALIALQAGEILDDKTATLALDALTLQHRLEARTECRFFGIHYDVKVKERLDEISQRVNDIGRSYKDRIRGEAEAEGNLVNDLILIYRNEGQFEAEAECMIRLRAARLKALQPNPVKYFFVWYFNKLVARGRALAVYIGINILVFSALFYLCILDKSLASEFDRLGRALAMGFFCFVTVQPPPMPEEWVRESYGFSCLNAVQGAAILSGYLHLGVLISVFYAKFYRR